MKTKATTNKPGERAALTPPVASFEVEGAQEIKKALGVGVSL